jgi:hypothetical protein
MADYSKGKIYKLSGNGRDYYGSTTQPLTKRYYHHKNNITGCIREMLGTDFKIELIEEFPCKTKQELEDRELFWINNNECVNTKKGLVKVGSEQEKTQRAAYMKQYRATKKDDIKIKKAKREIYNTIPSIIAKKLENYLIENINDYNLNDMCKKIINPEFLDNSA